jgi:hypothetical protein
VGGALAGLSIGLLYCLTVDPDANRLIMLPLNFFYGCVVGYCAGAAIEFTSSRFLQLVAQKHYSARVFNEVTGGIIGCAIAGVPVGVLGSLFFSRQPAEFVEIPLLVVGCLLGALFIALSILIYDYKGSVRAVIRALLLSMVFTIFPAAAAVAVLLRVRIDRLFTDDAIRDIFPPILGGAILGSVIGSLLGLLVGLTLLMYRVWKTDSGPTTVAQGTASL